MSVLCIFGYFVGSHEAGRLIFRLQIGALYGKMNLIVSEAPIDIVDGLHESFLSRILFHLIRREQVQLNAVIVLQLTQDDAGLFVLVILEKQIVQQAFDHIDDYGRIVGRRGQLDGISYTVLRQIGSVAVGSKKDSDRAAQRTLLTQFAGCRRSIIAQFAHQHNLTARHVGKSTAVHDGFLAVVAGQGDCRRAVQLLPCAQAGNAELTVDPCL